MNKTINRKWWRSGWRVFAILFVLAILVPFIGPEIDKIPKDVIHKRDPTLNLYDGAHSGSKGGSIHIYGIGENPIDGNLELIIRFSPNDRAGMPSLYYVVVFDSNFEKVIRVQQELSDGVETKALGEEHGRRIGKCKGFQNTTELGLTVEKFMGEYAYRKWLVSLIQKD